MRINSDAEAEQWNCMVAVEDFPPMKEIAASMKNNRKVVIAIIQKAELASQFLTHKKRHNKLEITSTEKRRERVQVQGLQSPTIVLFYFLCFDDGQNEEEKLKFNISQRLRKNESFYRNFHFSLLNSDLFVFYKLQQRRFWYLQMFFCCSAHHLHTKPSICIDKKLFTTVFNVKTKKLPVYF